MGQDTNERDKINEYEKRLRDLEPIRSNYHSQKESSIQTIIAATAGFSSFVFSQVEKFSAADDVLCLAFLVFMIIVYGFLFQYLRRQIYLKNGVSAQISAIHLDLWKISRGNLCAADIGLEEQEVSEMKNKYGITGSASSMPYWSKSYAFSVRNSYRHHSLRNTDTWLLVVSTTLSVLTTLNFSYIVFGLDISCFF
ncbi:MAG: hypothetical protein OIF40_15275 [Mangrovicoccus sp.]|nr:hypothetical protein [Mangrovicoccus sp.]